MSTALSTYIIEQAAAIAGGLVPCVKQSVFAMLVTASGKEFFGANWMSTPDVTVCPRVEKNCPSGTGYELCKEVCNQSFHAERFALDLCDEDPKGGTMYVVGHTYCCDDCLAAMTAAGIKTAIVLDSGKRYNF